MSKTFTVVAMPYGQGQANVISTAVQPNNPPLFYQRLVQLAYDNDDTCAAKGQAFPVYMPLLQVSHNNASPSGDGFADAQVDAAEACRLILLAGPDYQLEKCADRLHLTDRATVMKGRLLERVQVKRMFGGRGVSYKAFKLTGATFTGTAGTATFEVQVPPIIPATQWTGTFQKGLRVYDGSGDIALSNIVPHSTTITFDMARTPDAATARFRIAKDNAPPGWPIPLQGVADFIDSETETITIPTTLEVVALPNYPLSREKPMVAV